MRFERGRYLGNPKFRSLRYFSLRKDQARFLKRQLLLPVSMISQWWDRRSSSAGVIVASPNTVGHSPKARLAMMTRMLRTNVRPVDALAEGGGAGRFDRRQPIG
jgi:hypothetical protein